MSEMELRGIHSVINEVKNAQFMLEAKIIKAIKEFESQSLLTVTDIVLDRVDDHLLRSRSVLANVSAKVSL